MSTTLNLADRLLAMGRKFQDLGREHDALHYLGQLTDLRELTPEVSEESKHRLAEILLKSGRCIRARRHLSALLVQRPDSARYHYMMAGALNGDEKADPRRAAEHFRKSLRLDPKQPKCQGELGLLLLRLGQTEEGLTHLRQALELAPDDPEVLDRLTEGLRQEGETEEARNLLRAALFRHPRDGRFRKLWNDFHFNLLRQEQLASRQDATVDITSAPRILPFVRPEPTQEAELRAGKIIRHDTASAPQPPHTTRPSRLPSKKHA